MSTTLNMSLVLDPMTSDEGVTLGYNVVLDDVRVALWVGHDAGTYLLFNLNNQELHIGSAPPHIRFQVDGEPLFGRIAVTEDKLLRFTIAMIAQDVLGGAA